MKMASRLGSVSSKWVTATPCRDERREDRRGLDADVEIQLDVSGTRPDRADAGDLGDPGRRGFAFDARGGRSAGRWRA